MKMAQITMPKSHDTMPALLWLEREIVQRWKGYTNWLANGFWEDPEGNGFYEEVIVFQVAMERADVIHLREVAAELAARGDQQCVMIVTPNGDVEFIKAKEKVDG